MKLHDIIKRILGGSPTTEVKNFWQYFLHFPINYTTSLACLFFFGLFLYGEYHYRAPIFYFLSLFPLMIIAYNTTEEYYAFKWFLTGERKVSAKTLINIFAISSTLLLLSMILILFINKTN